MAAAVTLVVVLAIAVAGIGNGISNGLSHVGERRHLKPIHISGGACPYVALMHDAANDVQAHEPMLGLVFDAKGRPLPIAKERAVVDPPLARLEFAIAVSRPHFPAAVRKQLAITQAAAEEGRTQLAGATDSFALASSASRLYGTGQEAFGYASDLVGSQCGHGLGADSDVGPEFGPRGTFSPATTASRS